MFVWRDREAMNVKELYLNETTTISIVPLFLRFRRPKTRRIFMPFMIFYDQFSFGSNIGKTSTIRLDEIILFAAETISLTTPFAL